MARRSPSPFQTHSGSVVGENQKWKRVCIRCLQDNPRDESLLKVACLDIAGHGRFPTVQVWWWAEKNHLELYEYRAPERIPKIRPMPYSKFDGKFSLCDLSRCWGDGCKFAHSIEEREIWNAKKFRSKDVPSSKSLNTTAFKTKSGNNEGCRKNCLNGVVPCQNIH